MDPEPALVPRENQISRTATSATVGWRNRQPLTGAELTDFLALRGVCGYADSRVSRLGNHYAENEYPLLSSVENGLTVLIEIGHLTISGPGTALVLAWASRLGLPMPIHDGAVAARSVSTGESLTGLTSLLSGLVRSTK